MVTPKPMCFGDFTLALVIPCIMSLPNIRIFLSFATFEHVELESSAGYSSVVTI